VTEDVQTLVCVQGDHLKVAALANRPIEIAQLPVELHGNGRLCETGPDRLRNLETGDLVRVLDDLSIWITKL
jgi:hypothetical protein